MLLLLLDLNCSNIKVLSPNYKILHPGFLVGQKITVYVLLTFSEILLLEASVQSVSNHDLFVSAFCFRDLLEYRRCVICKMGHYIVLNQGIIQEFNLGIDSHVSITLWCELCSWGVWEGAILLYALLDLLTWNTFFVDDLF